MKNLVLMVIMTIASLFVLITEQQQGVGQWIKMDETALRWVLSFISIFLSGKLLGSRFLKSGDWIIPLSILIFFLVQIILIMIKGEMLGLEIVISMLSLIALISEARLELDEQSPELQKT